MTTLVKSLFSPFCIIYIFRDEPTGGEYIGLEEPGLPRGTENSQDERLQRDQQRERRRSGERPRRLSGEREHRTSGGGGGGGGRKGGKPPRL